MKICARCKRKYFSNTRIYAKLNLNGGYINEFLVKGIKIMFYDDDDNLSNGEISLCGNCLQKTIEFMGF